MSLVLTRIVCVYVAKVARSQDDIWLRSATDGLLWCHVYEFQFICYQDLIGAKRKPASCIKVQISCAIIV